MRAKSRAAVSAAALLIGATALGWAGSARAERTIYSFPGAQVGSVLTADRAGNLYGVTAGGLDTIDCSSTSCGTVFRLVPPAAKGQGWTEQTLYNFPPSGANGALFEGAGGQLALDAAGNIYGTSENGGGSANAGTAWRLSPPAAPNGTWTFTLLHTFTGGSDGAYPAGGVVVDHSGTLYGTTLRGGASNKGVVFSLTPPAAGGTTWTEAVLHAFAARADATSPDSALVLSSHDTALTGVAWESLNKLGKRGNGAVFRLRRVGNSWTYHLVYRFPGPYSLTGPLTGSDPDGPVVVDRNNNIFGTAARGGTASVGVVFELSPPAPGQSNWTEQVIYNFTPYNVTTASGWFPGAGLVAGGSPPALFGITGLSRGRAVDGSTGADGQVFRLDPPASGTGPWAYTALHAFAVDYQHRGGAGLGPLTFGLHRFLFGVAYHGEKKRQGPFVYVLSPHIPAAPAGAAP